MQRLFLPFIWTGSLDGVRREALGPDHPSLPPVFVLHNHFLIEVKHTHSKAHIRGPSVCMSRCKTFAEPQQAGCFGFLPSHDYPLR